jgi:hypothetical protein
VRGRAYVEITELVSGITFRFYTDRIQSHRLHIAVRWDVEPETAISVFFDESADRRWIAEKECFETRSETFILVWLYMAPQHVLVITCVPRHRSQSPLPE